MRRDSALGDFGILLRHGARDDDDVGVADVVGAVADHHARAELLEALGDRIRLEVAALHFVAEVHEHFGDAAHATAADADEVDAVNAAHAIAHAASICSRQTAASSSAARGLRDEPRALGHREQLAAARAQLLELGGEALGGEIAIRDQHRGAFAHEVLRVEGLVIVDRGGERHEHRRRRRRRRARRS